MKLKKALTILVLGVAIVVSSVGCIEDTPYEEKPSTSKYEKITVSVNDLYASFRDTELYANLHRMPPQYIIGNFESIFSLGARHTPCEIAKNNDWHIESLFFGNTPSRSRLVFRVNVQNGETKQIYLLGDVPTRTILWIGDKEPLRLISSADKHEGLIVDADDYVTSFKIFENNESIERLQVGNNKFIRIEKNTGKVVTETIGDFLGQRTFEYQNMTIPVYFKREVESGLPISYRISIPEHREENATWYKPITFYYYYYKNREYSNPIIKLSSENETKFKEFICDEGLSYNETAIVTVLSLDQKYGGFQIYRIKDDYLELFYEDLEL